MSRVQYLGDIHRHCRAYFAGHSASTWEWTLGPIRAVAPWFRVLRFAPGPRTELWSYVSLGAPLYAEHPSSAEFLILTEHESPRPIELLAVVAYYQRSYRLRLGDTVAVGQPWLDGSVCDHLLVTLPYPFGPELEICKACACEACGADTRVLWLLPITRSEARFREEHGLEALERRFDESGMEYWRADRLPVA